MKLHVLDFCKYLFNLMCIDSLEKKRQKQVKEFVDSFSDTDLFEIVESYFKVMRKYGLPVYEEPYYFVTPKHRREIRHTGEMLKRSTDFDENEIWVSLLEVFE